LPFHYDLSPTSLPLCQGEIIFNLLEIVPVISNKEDIDNLPDERKPVSVVKRTHPIVLVVTQDCDIEWDWKVREAHSGIKKDDKDECKILEHIQLCDIFEYKDIRFSRGFNSKLWERVKSNQDERYHRFKEAAVEGSGDEALPELFADFKRVFTIPTEYLCTLVSSGFVIRKAKIAEPYLRDLIQRLFSYLSRVAIPEEEDVL